MTEARSSGDPLLRHSRLTAALLLTALCLSDANGQGLAPDRSKVLDDLIQTYRDRAIPPDPYLVYQEIDRLDELTTEWSPYIAIRSDARQKVNTLQSELKTWLDTVTGADCKAPGSEKSLLQGIVGINAKYSGENYVTETLEELLRKPGAARSCTDLKAIVSAEQQSIRDELLRIDEDTKLKASQMEEWSKKAQELVNLLNRRKQQLNDTLSTTKARANLADKLWMLIGVIGVLSLSAIALVNRFSPTLQYEWVASGQVIQFVTVMILLSVTMVLGLSDILKEETLGTLLGAIAGYVLSQGVGRAVAREINRTRSDAAHEHLASRSRQPDSAAGGEV
jgi:hypothetical protein